MDKEKIVALLRNVAVRRIVIAVAVIVVGKLGLEMAETDVAGLVDAIVAVSSVL